MMDPLKTLRDLWKTIKPAERQETLFGLRYNKMQTVYATLNQAEKNRMDFFMAAAAEDGQVRDYVGYIRVMEKFCALCVREPDSNLARGLDPLRMSQLKTSVDLLSDAVRMSDKNYLDRVRKEMPVPIGDAMRAYVRRVEIRMLKETVLPEPGKP